MNKKTHILNVIVECMWGVWMDYNIKMSSNKFLQRFQGKMQVLGKQGVRNIIGGKNENVVVSTNINFNPQNKNKTATSLNKPKPPQEPQKQPKISQKNIPHTNETSSKKQIPKPAPAAQNKQKKVDSNPFLISNPFYLDEEDKERIENERKERQLLEKQEKERERQAQKLAQLDTKKNTNNSLNKSLQKKKNEKEWIKLGGLGANIGGDDWMQKKKKLDKMQEFSEQVKSINKDKPKIPKQEKAQKKEVNPRQKALQYSKNVPKPSVRVVPFQKQEEVVEEQKPAEEKLSELQLYQLRHEQYKNMLRNQL